MKRDLSNFEVSCLFSRIDCDVQILNLLFKFLREVVIQTINHIYFLNMSKLRMNNIILNNYQGIKLRLVSPLLFTKTGTPFQTRQISRQISRQKQNEACCNRHKKILTVNTMQEQISKLANRDPGNIMEQAKQITKDLAKGKKSSFCKVIDADNDDLHAACTTPITFLRQVLVLCMYPKLLQDSRFFDDAKCRAKCILSNIKGSSLGTCPHHLGLPLLRQHMAEYISMRDNGVNSGPQNLIIHNSTNDAIKSTLKLFAKCIEGKPTGVLLPIPHPPIYSSWLSELGLYEVGYKLNEKKNWTVNKKELENSIAEAHCHSVPRVIVAVNPGNPTGQVFSRQNVTEIIKFAHKEKLFMIADEIYQENVYSETSEFYSFKKVKHELGPPYDKMELASFLSASKGIYGECGLSACCVELDEIDECVREKIEISQSNLLGPNMVGQVVLSCMAKPPTEENESFESYLREKCCILTGLMQKARYVSDRLNSMPMITMVPIEGGLYGYGKVEVPKLAIKEAASKNLDPSELWCKKLLESTGIHLTPGTAFGNADSFYFRISFVQTFETLETIMDAIKQHQVEFLKSFNKN